MSGFVAETLKWFGGPIAFDPQEGQTIIAPAGPGKGNWAGAPSVVYDAETAKTYLYYRVRKPRPIRGGECHIAESSDGIHFDTIWSATKEDFNSTSVERFCITKALDGKWLLYPSYVDPADSRWRIDVIQADHPGAFDISARKKVLTASDVGVQGVKDPWVMVVNGLYTMLISYAVTVEVDEAQQGEMHATADIYNTGLTLSSTALAVSGDGLTYEWQGDIFPPRAGQWDAYAARLGCVIPTANGWVGYYDGAASVEGNYEERTGIVQSWDLRHFYRLSQSAPSIVSPYASGGLRYIDTVLLEDEILFYYEYCRPDGSHELRMNRVPR